MANKPLILISLPLVLIIALFAPAKSFPEPGRSVKPGQSDETPTLEEAWDVLSDYHKNTDNIERSIEITQQILSKEPDNVDALLFLSRLWLTYGYVKARTRDEYIRAYENGKNTAEKAVKLAPDNPDAHFFYVANLASLGDAKGLFNSLFMLPEVRRELETILELDPNHVKGLAMTGALYYYLPGILGGDLHISEVYLRRALRIDPHISSVRLYMAMNLRKQKKYDEAIVELRELINDKKPSFYPDWYVNRRYAARMLGNIHRIKKKETAKKANNGGVN
jgi:tetratricopeptide (TPR) repeat protein